MEKIGEVAGTCRSLVGNFISSQQGKDFSAQGIVQSARSSKKLVLIIVFIALFLDNMLLTTVVPVIPNLLSENDAEYFDPVPEINITTVSLGEIPDRQTRIKYSQQCSTAKARQVVYENVTAAIWHMNYMSVIKTTLEVPPCFREENFTKTVKKLGKLRRHTALVNENVKVGVMFASKAVVQLLTNPVIGPLTNRIGYTIPMFSGFVILTVSTTIFAFATSYGVLFFARALQGIGSACSSTAGMGMLASHYTDDVERGQALGFALGGLALGVLVGPPFGGFMYQFVGKEAPFLILAALAVIDGAMQLVLLNPTVKPEDQKGTPLFVLLRDPYILITTGAIMLGNIGIAMLEPTLPIWMLDTMEASKFEQGAAFLPASVSYLIGTSVFGRLAHVLGRWKTGLIGMLVVAFALFVIPFATNVYHLIFPNFCLGFAVGMVDSSMMPTMGQLVDLRYVSVYGTVYAIADVAFCMGFAVGPALSGNMVKSIGFNWMLWTIALINILFSPLFFFLKNPPAKDSHTEAAAGAMKFTTDGAYEQLKNADEGDYGYGGANQSASPDFVANESHYYGSNETTANPFVNPHQPPTLESNQQSGYGY